MAWRCSASSNAELVHNLLRAGIIKNDRVKEAMLSVDRAHFATADAYEDSPQRIGSGATISAPHMHGYALQALAPRLVPGARVLDVGCGSGYLTAVFAHMVSPSGRVVGIDHIDSLVELSRKNIDQDCPKFLEDGTIELVVGDGRQGFAAAGPYDAIHVGAAVGDSIQPFVDQLKPGGLMFIPQGHPGSTQAVYFYAKDSAGKHVHRDVLMPVSYVPLTSRDNQVGLQY